MPCMPLRALVAPHRRLLGSSRSTRVGALPLCVQDPARCPQGVQLSPASEFPGAATKDCSAAEAQASLPSISKLIVSTPQVGGLVWQPG